MAKRTRQMTEWGGDFGRAYTDRNKLNADEMDALYEKTYGLSRTALNKRFLSDIDQSARILEVGSNIGTQLALLRRLGFDHLCGAELQGYAIALAKTLTPSINLVRATAFEIPFGDGSFDVVFTSGLRIHIHPSDLHDALKEIHRCSQRYIWGLEHCANECIEVMYRGKPDLLWNTDYAATYLRLFGDLELVKEERFGYADSDRVDAMFLLRKKGS